MNRNEVMDYVGRMDANSLLNLCDNITEFRYQSGLLKPDCALKCLASDLQYYDIRDLEDVIVNAAHEKFHDLVGLLVKDAPNKYMK